MTRPRSDEPFLRIGPADAKVLMEKKIQLVDVREPQEFAQLRIPGFSLIPLGTLMRAPREFLKEEPVLFICSEGIRSAVACEMAAAIGLDEVYNLEGGTARWESEGWPVETGTGGERGTVDLLGAPPALEVDFLQSGEQLIRVHRFRFLRAVGCALGGITVLVEESLGEVRDRSRRCTARPDHPERVPRPELTVFGESVEEVLRLLIAKLRGRRPHEIFLPTE